ncbi:MAG TPA: zinc-dependent alcohol dehydrogenase family protein [Candidatus Binatia bacterium]|nr:zinc-dependent alcohol dehydrogenase family protein [Candidatus Binatia bacterium]
MRAVVFTGTGDASILRVIDLPARDPGPGEVRIRVTSAGLNRADANYRLGRYLVRTPGESRSGFEGAGVVEAAGAGVDLRPGDRVGVLPSSFDVVSEGACAESMTVPAAVCVPTPSTIADRDAGAIWMQYLTAWGALVEIAAIGPGDHVVIPAASSSVGIAAIQLCHAAGARAIATTTSPEKVEALRRFAPWAIVDTTHEPYVDRVRALTDGRGARVVFDPVWGPLVNDHVRAAGREAIVFVYGALDSRPLVLELGGMLRKQIRLQGYTLGPLLSDPVRRARAVASITAHLERGDFAPAIDSYFPLERIVDAHRRLESNRQIGKVVVTPSA